MKLVVSGNKQKLFNCLQWNIFTIQNLYIFFTISIIFAEHKKDHALIFNYILSLYGVYCHEEMYMQYTELCNINRFLSKDEKFGGKVLDDKLLLIRVMSLWLNCLILGKVSPKSQTICHE